MITARNTEHLQATGNVEIDSTDWLSATVTPTTSNKICEAENDVDNKRMDLMELETDRFHDFGILQDDALEYIAGYMIRKMNLEEYQCEEYSFSWVDQVSKGYLKNRLLNSWIPSKDWNQFSYQ